LPSNLCIELGADNYRLQFRVLDTPIAAAWIERMAHRGNYPLDHPDRFYGFGTQAEEIAKAQLLLQRCVDVINRYSNIITQPVDATDQDCLNYLHNIFEMYHGLLDAQQHEFWAQAPELVKNALAELNINVHRAESAIRSNKPRFVCTWYGMPKTKILSTDLMSKYGTLTTEFGVVYLNYAEIGKTLEDLTVDRDHHISADAFRPFNHYSADFVVKFSDVDPAERILEMREYYIQNQKFFIDRGFDNFDDPRLLPLQFPVARLKTELLHEQILQDIGCRQHINRVYFD
jgi:hypothetical protein